jgi:hypothetical protein
MSIGGCIMKRAVFIAVLAGFVLLFASGAYADTVGIALGVNGSGPISILAPLNSGISSGSTSVGGEFGWTVSGTIVGTPPNSEPTLDSFTVDASDTSQGLISLQIYASEIGLSSPTGINNFLSGFTTNLILGHITSVTESTYVDTSNGLFTTPAGGLLSTQTFLGPSAAQSVTISAVTPNLTAPYSETEVFNIVATGIGNTQDTITISEANAVPEPGTLTLFGSGLIALAGLLRRKFAGA